MNLDEAQRKQVTEWIGQGLKLAEIQTRLASELGLKLTYMEVRLLVDDLKLVPKDPEPPKPVEPAPSALSGHTQAPAAPPGTTAPKPGPSAGRSAGVSVVVDKLARPGALVSGKVTFSDGETAEWHLDQTGQIGFVPRKPGYRPPAADLQQFQAALDTELSRMGF
jgi:hypothetical protein